jgi:hypothetical protein
MLSPEDLEKLLPQAQSLSVLYDYAQNFIQQQLSQADALDTKASFVLGSASLLAAGVVAFQQALGSVGASLKTHNYSEILVVAPTAASILLFLAVVICSWLAFSMRNYATIGHLRYMWNTYLTASEDETKYRILSTLLSASDNNTKELNSKVRWTKIALGLLLAESFAVALLIGLQTWVLLTF